ncbi:MAG: fatty acid oxidation complex subunit alpha FadJ [Myxococcales bacterium]|nr:fatty acid oxidation complex subunit alpha FadJ [Myxococcales bacterium]MCB9649030.1 fatty acid oxidation complex subunit alpha FadJ [Deltaproteobacteria bacterium]
MTKSITFELREDGVGVFWLDVPDAPQNTLKESFKADMEAAKAELQQSGAKAAVIASKKPGSFLAGADIEAFGKITTADQAATRAKGLQAELDALEASAIPFVAAIDGACLGGGLELALACHARVASDDKKTKLGLPEVQLGLLPAGGGTQRLPRTVGLEAALDMMLTGKQIDGRRAKKIGLVEEVVPPSILVDAAAQVALRLAADKREPTLAERVAELTDAKALRELALAKNPAGRKVVFDQAEKTLKRKAGEHYPAPYEILRVTRVGLEKGIKKGLAAEAEAFGRLMMTDVSRRLVEIFFATVALKKDNGTDQPNLAPRPVKKLGILGAGIMGHGIASVSAGRAGLMVRMKDRDDAAVARGLAEVRKLAESAGKKRKLRPLAVEHELLRVSGSTDYSGFGDCDLVVEAVFEDLAVKHQVLKEVEAACKADVIFASNTSSIPITRIAEPAKRPENVIGMHYFSPVHKMPLLEIIRTEKTSDEVVATCVAVGKKQGKTVIVVNDGVGFYTSRVLGPYMNEAAWMMMDGIPVETIDAAAKAFGFPVGPVTLLDEVGIDTAAKVAKIAGTAFGDRMVAPGSLDKLVADGRTGRKGNKGFYVYGGEAKGKEVDESVYGVLGINPDRKKKHDLAALGERLALPMVSEAIRCLEEGILRNPRDGDIGAVFGLGFPPFRGGPFRYADALGPAELLRRVRGLEDRFGRRFAPAQLLVDHASSGKRFF